MPRCRRRRYRCAIHVDGNDVDVYESNVPDEDENLLRRRVEVDFLDDEIFLECLSALLVEEL